MRITSAKMWVKIKKSLKKWQKIQMYFNLFLTRERENEVERICINYEFVLFAKCAYDASRKTYFHVYSKI